MAIWGYNAGTSGTITLSGNKKVIGITAFSSTGGTLIINDGDSITIVANTALVFTPLGFLEDPTCVFSSTSSYIIEWATS